MELAGPVELVEPVEGRLTAASVPAELVAPVELVVTVGPEERVHLGLSRNYMKIPREHL